ncbi:MAG: hypothetical protein JO321_08805 [Solirubrobacterales bacterium]|nr:hypothetical protein [Solirubrobacterales bacterium]
MSVSKKFACGLLAAGAPLASAGALALASTSSAGALPVLTVTMNGKSITVSGNVASGAVDVHSVVSGEKQGNVVLVRLNQGVTQAQIIKALAAASKDPNAAQLVGAIAFNSRTPKGHPTDVQTVLQPAKRYLALDVGGKGKPRLTQFTVSPAAKPATLPAAASTTKAIEFGFRGSTTLKNGTMTRGINDGWLVHMNDFLGAKSKSDAKKLAAGLKAGKSMKKLRKYLTRSFFEVFGPVSHGAVQQFVLQTKPGYYVEACFMTTQDRRVHTVLGMERVVKVVK